MLAVALEVGLIPFALLVLWAWFGVPRWNRYLNRRVNDIIDEREKWEADIERRRTEGWTDPRADS